MYTSAAVVTQTEPAQRFLQGAPFPAVTGIPYPRLGCEAPLSRLPQDTWASASVPASVRLAFKGQGDSVTLHYQHHEPAEAYGKALTLCHTMRASLVQCFELWRENQRLAEAPVNTAVGSRHSVTLSLSGPGTYTLYLPELSCIELATLQVAGGAIEPVTAQPLWLAYGDSITEGWSATMASGCWPAIVAREANLNMFNLGFAGAARGELVVAETIAAQPADLLSISYGTNCWSRIPASLDLFKAGLRAFIQRVRVGHAHTPIVYMSPILRPAAEAMANDLGATLAGMREGSREVIDRLREEGDPQLHYLDGWPLVTADQLVDGVHPDDRGHAAMARAFLALLKQHGLPQQAMVAAAAAQPPSAGR
jgi:lysophospholipase L1-like esterase